MERYTGRFIEYPKLRTRKSGHMRDIDMHLVVPRQMAVQQGHTLNHGLSAEIGQHLPHSQILVPVGLPGMRG